MKSRRASFGMIVGVISIAAVFVFLSLIQSKDSKEAGRSLGSPGTEDGPTSAPSKAPTSLTDEIPVPGTSPSGTGNPIGRKPTASSPEPPTPRQKEMGASVRSGSMFPPADELVDLQKQVSSGERQELKDPRFVAETYLTTLYKSASPNTSPILNLGEFAPNSSNSIGKFLFNGSTTLAPGSVVLYKYSWPVGQPDDLWYVLKVKTELMREGEEGGGDSYEGTKLFQTLDIKKDGKVDILLEAVGESTPIIEETRGIRCCYPPIIIERTLSKHYRLFLKAVFKASDGQVGILEKKLG